jgi:hypothetical protein
MEAKPVRGKERKIPSYLAQRGWWDAEVQRVVRKWEPVLGQEAVEDAFLVLRRWYEDGTGTALAVQGPRHLNFV